MDFLQFRHRAAFAATLAMLACSAQAVPTVIDPWHSAGNGTVLGTNYGVPNLTVTFMGKATPGASPNTDQMRVWALWGSLYHVAYSPTAWADVGITPNAGWSQGVSLFSFDLGSYYGAQMTSDLQIWNGDYSSLLSSQTVGLEATGVTISPNLFSSNGFHVQFQSAGYVAIDNITVEAGNTVPVPEPETWAMLLAGLGLVGFAARRRIR